MNSQKLDEILNTMTTLSEVTNLLSERGYTADFNLKEDCLECNSSHIKLLPGEFTVDKHYRFEGPSNPDDEAIVFAISSKKHNLKGILINGYGISSTYMSAEMIKALDERNIE